MSPYWLQRARDRVVSLGVEYRRTFWALHSLWALITGVVVLVLAHERYGFARWVIVFLALTWLSTIFFSRISSRLSDSAATRLGREFVSYLTRVMYQETLFFLLPFYYTAATLRSSNVFFVGLLAVLAVLSCLDLVFDRLLRRRKWFGFLFFSLVSFASLNFLMPVVFGLTIDVSTPLAAGLGLAAALPLSYGPTDLGRARSMLQIGFVTLVAVLVVGPGRFLLPPVPLALEELVFAEDVKHEPLTPSRPLSGTSTAPLRERLRKMVVVAEIFAPQRLEVDVQMSWYLDGERIRRSREVTVYPHRWGFGVWDAFSVDDNRLPSGLYEVEVMTDRGQLIGRSEIELLVQNE